MPCYHFYMCFSLEVKCYTLLALRLWNAGITHWTFNKPQTGIWMSQIRLYPHIPHTHTLIQLPPTIKTTSQRNHISTDQYWSFIFLQIDKTWKTVSSELKDREKIGTRKFQGWEAEIKLYLPKKNNDCSCGKGEQGKAWPDPNENLLASLYCILTSI